ncbi:mitochondrial genome maintenance MGM101, partial [Phlyctochytrium arcticum]
YDTLSSKSFAQSAIDTLTRPVQLDELEIDPDRGFIYVRENVYEEILDTAFGSDGWTLHPLTPFHTLNDKIVYRTYALFVHSRFVSEAIGDWSLKTCQGDREVAEAKCRHTALVRVCKDIGVASELWDPRVVNTMRDKVFESVWDDDGEGARRKVWR